MLVKAGGSNQRARDRPATAASATPASAPLLVLKDLLVLAKLPPSGMIAWCLPERAWEPLAAQAVRLERRTVSDLAQRISRMLGPERLAAPALELARRHQRQVRLDQLQFLRSWRPGGGWRPEQLRLEGGEHLDAALAAGRGAVLWVAPTVHQWLLTKRTLREAGYAVHHLSNPSHGFSTTSRLGRAVINPIRTRIEDRYLAERVRLGTGGAAQAALRRLTDLLRANAVVSITLAAGGARPLETSFLSGVLRAATGAPHLAARNGAVLLPVFTFRTGPGRFQTRIEAPVTAAGSTGADPSLRAALETYARRLEPYALTYPDQITWRLDCIGEDRAA